MDIADASYFRNLIGLVFDTALDRSHDGDEPCTRSALTTVRHRTPFVDIDKHTGTDRERVALGVHRSKTRDCGIAITSLALSGDDP